jgi:hypothetical protein
MSFLLTLSLVALATPPARSIAAPCFPVPTFLTVLQDLAPASPFYRDWTTYALSAWYWGRFYSVDPRLPLAISLSGLSLLLARPLGGWLQGNLTTAGEVEGLEVTAIRPLRRGWMRAYRISTRG